MARLKRTTLLVLVLMSIILQVPAMDVAEQGIKLFMDNNPKEALPALEQAVRLPGAEERLHLYLGIAYQQLGRWEDAITAFRRGVAVKGQYLHLFFYNIANSFFAQGRNSFAIESYDQAIAARNDYAPAYLNRANARMKVGDQTGALADYGLYLNLDPGSAQAGAIRSLMSLLSTKAEEAEQRRLAEIAQKLAAEQARQAFLDAIAQSLRETAEATTNLSAGSGEVQGYEDDFALDD